MSAMKPAAKAGATDKAVESGAACALCGFAPGAANADQLRNLGAEPVTLTVCADREACVTRYGAAAAV